MGLATKISSAFHDVTIADSTPAVADHLRTLIIDALACILGGAQSDSARLARRSIGGAAASAQATILPDGPAARAADAALVNGSMLRSLDFMDVYVDADVTHPSESIPAALACAEAGGASGRDFLDTVLACLTLHVHLAGTIALHRNGLHHVGHAAWVVPLAAGRLLGLGADGAANALNLSASGLIVPEGFSRGHVANVKGMAFALLAKRAIELAELGAGGLRAQPGAMDEMAQLLGRILAAPLDPAALVPPVDAARALDITLKTYPAQYALQPLVAAGAAFRRRHPDRVAQIAAIKVRAARQTVARTGDPAKFRPASREAADHSLPFCLACGLLDGELSVDSFARSRWRDADVLRLAGAMTVEAIDTADAFAVGRQEITLTFADGRSLNLPCDYPAAGTSWREIALAKLEQFAAGPCAAARILAAVETLEHEASVTPLIAALRSGA